MPASRKPLRRRSVLAGAAVLGAAAALPLRFAHAQGAPLKIGVLLPRSGIQAQLGIDAGRGADLAAEALPGRGFRPARSSPPTPRRRCRSRAHRPRS